MSKKGRIFLSYGHDEHVNIVKRLKDDLEKEGYEVWFDEQRLAVGSGWAAEIEKGLEMTKEMDGKFILAITPHAVRRPDGFCLNELQMALDMGMPVIPVMIEEARRPITIYTVQYLDLRDNYENKLQELLKAIESKKYDFETIQLGIERDLRPLEFKSEIKIFSRHFVGRKWVFDEVEKWMVKEKGRKVFWITGLPGSGKSAIAGKLMADRNEVITFHSCNYRVEENRDARKFVMTLAYQLSNQIKDYAEWLNKVVEDRRNDLDKMDAATLFNVLLAQPLAKTKEENELVVCMIDALDEATVNGKNEIVEILRDDVGKFPDWLKIIVTARPETIAIGAAETFVLDLDREENREDIRQYLRENVDGIEEDQVEHVLELSEGSFLFVKEVCQGLSAGDLSLDRLSEFPQGIKDVYDKYFGRMDEDVYIERVKPLLEVMVAAYVALDTKHLLECLDYDEGDFEDVKECLGSLFIEQDNKYIPFHKSVVDWLEKASKPWKLSLRNGHALLAEYLINTDEYLFNDYKANYIGYHIANGKFRPENVLQVEEMRDGKGQNTLHFAARRGEDEVIVDLIKRGFNPKIGCNNGILPLHLAAQNGHLEVIKKMKKSVDLTKGDNFGDAAIHYAAMNGHIDIIEYLLENGVDVYQGNSLGCCCVHVAAQWGQLEVLKWLEQKGVDLKIKNFYNDPVIHYSAEWGHVEVTEFLFKLGCFSNHQAAWGSTVVDYAENSRSEKVKDLLIQRGYWIKKSQPCEEILNEDIPPLFKIVMLGDVASLMKELTTNELDLIYDGKTLLHEACYRGNLEIVKIIIDKFGSIELEDSQGETPVFSAVRGNNIEIIKNLIDREVDYSKVSVHGFGLLDIACRKGFTELGLYLIEIMPESVNSIDIYGGTPLHHAARAGCSELISALVKCGANVHASDNMEMTPIRRAIYSGNVLAIKVLQKEGANIFAVDSRGWSLLHAAARVGEVGILKYFISQGFDKNQLTTGGVTPLYLAESRNMKEAAEYLKSIGAK